jgi:transposase-like protein DUF772
LRRALLLQVRYTGRRARRLMEQRSYHVRVWWFVGLHRDEPIGAPTVFRTHRQRLLAGELAQAFFAQVRAWALLSDEHGTVDGTLIDAWAGQKRVKPTQADLPVEPPDAPGHRSLECRGERRTNTTQASTTAPEVRFYTHATGAEAPWCSVGPALRENRQAGAHHPLSRLCSQSAETPAGRRPLWLAEDGSPAAQDQAWRARMRTLAMLA